MNNIFPIVTHYSQKFLLQPILCSYESGSLLSLSTNPPPLSPPCSTSQFATCLTMPNIQALSDDRFDDDTYQVNYNHGRKLATLPMPSDPRDAGVQLRNLVPYNSNPDFTFSGPLLESIQSSSNNEPTNPRKKSRAPSQMNDDEPLLSPLIAISSGEQKEERAQRLVAKFSRRPISLPYAPYTTSKKPRSGKKSKVSTHAGTEKAPQAPSKAASHLSKTRPGRPSKKSKAAKESAVPVRRSARIAAKRKK